MKTGKLTTMIAMALTQPQEKPPNMRQQKEAMELYEHFHRVVP